MDVHRIDPSLALAFYLPDRAAFEDLIKRIGEVRNNKTKMTFCALRYDCSCAASEM